MSTEAISRTLSAYGLGSVHDAKVFTNSSLNQILQKSNLIPNTLHFPRPNVNEIIPNYIIGDPAYPLLLCCIK